jgi:hypothetical protein
LRWLAAILEPDLHLGLPVRRFAAATGKPPAEAGGTGAGISFHVLVRKTVDDVVYRVETMSDDIETLLSGKVLCEVQQVSCHQ